MKINRKHVRHGRFERVRHSDDFLAFLSTESARLSGTGAGTAFTAANATDLLTATAHPYTSGDGPFLLVNSGGALPTGTDNTTLYWLGVEGVNTVKLYLTEEDAIASTNVVAFTTDGTGTHALHIAADSLTIFEKLKDGATSAEIYAETDIDNL